MPNTTTHSSSSTTYGICAACLQAIETRRFLTCCLCQQKYDIVCVNVPEKRFFNTMTAEHKSKWQCDACKNKKPKKINSDTPVRQMEMESSVTTRKRANIKSAVPPLPSPSLSPCATEGATVAPSEHDQNNYELLIELRLLREEMKAVRTEMQEFRTTINNLTTTVEVCNRRIDELAERVNAVENHQCGASTDTTALERTIADLKIDLNDRDQELLCNDIEIAGLPEEKNENCCHTALTVAQKLGVHIEEGDLVSAERVGPIRRTQSSEEVAGRPRPLVLRLTRRALRDRLLAAARVRRGTTTPAGIASGSTARPFYVNERLTPTNRQLFYKARAETSRLEWKYVWTREGKIYVRKGDGEPRFRLRSEADLAKIFG